MNYPPNQLFANERFVIAQMSDLHLTGSTCPSAQKFVQLLSLVKDSQPDLLLLTGDLVNDGDSNTYDWLFAQLTKTQIPFLCLAGNHDVSIEHGKGLPFAQRSLTPIKADKRLLDKHRLTITLTNDSWQLLLLNSAISGQIGGRISDDGLAWLTQCLKTPCPTLIALHHHPLTVGSAWIDAYRLENSAVLWQQLNHYPNVKALLCGHVHQAHTLNAPTLHPCYVYTCPAISRQFMPHQDKFMLDNQPSGLRFIELNKQGIFRSQIKRWHDFC